MKNVSEGLSLAEVRNIVSFSFFVVQSVVELDELMMKLFGKLDLNIEINKELDFIKKIDVFYQILKESIKKDNWKNVKIGYNQAIFSPSKLKSVLTDIAIIRNNFSHKKILISGKHDCCETHEVIGAIEMFFNASSLSDFPQDLKDDLDLRFNQKFLERKQLIALDVTEIYFGEVGDENLKPTYDKSDTHLKDFFHLKHYFHELDKYAKASLFALNGIFDEVKLSK